MADEGRETIPLESNKNKSDLVVNQQIMQMIDTDIPWYEQTFREIITELRKIQNNRNLPLSLGGVKNVMKGYCPPTSMGLPITLSPPIFSI